MDDVGAVRGRRGQRAGLGCRHRHPGAGSSGRRDVGTEVGHSGLGGLAPAPVKQSPGRLAAVTCGATRRLVTGTMGAEGCSRLGDKTGFLRGVTGRSDLGWRAEQRMGLQSSMGHAGQFGLG